jgi:hypothetical protein
MALEYGSVAVLRFLAGSVPPKTPHMVRTPTAFAAEPMLFKGLNADGSSAHFVDVSQKLNVVRAEDVKNGAAAVEDYIPEGGMETPNVLLSWGGGYLHTNNMSFAGDTNSFKMYEGSAFAVEIMNNDEQTHYYSYTPRGQEAVSGEAEANGALTLGTVSREIEAFLEFDVTDETTNKRYQISFVQHKPSSGQNAWATIFQIMEWR